MSYRHNFLVVYRIMSISRELNLTLNVSHCREESRKLQEIFSSHDIAVIQWITSCHKNRITTRLITLWRVHITSLTTSMPTKRSSFK